MPALVGCCPPAGKGRGKGGFCTFFGARPRGQRGEEQQQQREPQGPAPLHGAGRDRDLGPDGWPGREALGKPGGPSGGGGGASTGAGPRPHLVHLLKGTVGQEGNLLDR